MAYNTTTTLANNFDIIKEHVNDLDNSELVNFHNICCQNSNNSDDEIYTNDEEFFNMFFDGKVIDAVRAICYGEYKYSDDYVIFNGYANLESFDNPTEHISIDEIVNDILENPESYDIELEDCFILDGTIYEGTEENAKEQFEEYKTETEEENNQLEEDEDKTEVLTFENWCIENLTTI